MKNKGFTLIELLAVIVILAIIALIATPIILNIIDNTKEQSVKRSIDHYMSAATAAIARENLNNTSGGVNPTECEINSSGNLVCDGYEDKDPILVEIDGDKPKTGGTITFENGKITQIHLTMPDGNTYGLDAKGNVVLVGSGEGSGGGTDITPVCTVSGSSKYSVGDIVTCDISGTASDKFYVIEEALYTATSIKVLTEKNINVVEPYRQSDSAGTIAFSSTNYWSSETEYPVDVYDKGTNNITTVVDGYVNYLKGTLSGNITGQLLTTTQVDNLGCSISNHTCNGINPGNINIGYSAPSWVYGNYWFGFAKSSTMMWRLVSIGLMGEIPYNIDTAAGVRPVIILPTSNIQK